MKLIENCGKKKKKTRKLTESTWCGVPGTKYWYHGGWNDPEVELGMCLYNEWDIQDYLYSFVEDKDKFNIDSDDIQDIVDCIDANCVALMISDLTPTGGVSDKFEDTIYKATSFEELREILKNLKNDENCNIPYKVLDMAIEKANVEDTGDVFEDNDRVEEEIPEIVELVDKAVSSGEYIW